LILGTLVKETTMKPCRCLKIPKHKPYGVRKGKHWCRKCDANLVGDYDHKPIKKAARREAKRLIQREIKDID
jgi:hypothetical protein